MEIIVTNGSLKTQFLPSQVLKICFVNKTSNNTCADKLINTFLKGYTGTYKHFSAFC